MLALLKKEINGFLSTLTAYIAMVVFLLVLSFFLWMLDVDLFLGLHDIISNRSASLFGLFAVAPYVFMFLIPAITMRMFAEEKRTGTFELLLTQPLSDMQIVLAKFLAGVLLVIFSLLPTLLYFYSVYQLGDTVGNIDAGATWASYLGLLLLGACFVAIGIFASSLTGSQILSFIFAALICVFMFIGFSTLWKMQVFGGVALFIHSLGMLAHYESIMRGVIDLRDVVYFLSVIVIFLMMTKFVLAGRKW
jgi:ABC-2 type transport system permease protein